MRCPLPPPLLSSLASTMPQLPSSSSSSSSCSCTGTHSSFEDVSSSLLDSSRIDFASRLARRATTDGRPMAMAQARPRRCSCCLDRLSVEERRSLPFRLFALHFSPSPPSHSSLLFLRFFTSNEGGRRTGGRRTKRHRPGLATRAELNMRNKRQLEALSRRSQENWSCVRPKGPRL